MSTRIVCTTQEPSYAPRTHAHIVAVGIGNNPNKADERLTLQQVLDRMDRGENFHTLGVTSGQRARVVPVACGVCGHRIIRSTPDAVYDNNLDSLRTCNWN